MDTIKGFKNSWILTEDGLVKTNLIINDGKIDKIGSYIENDLIEIPEDKIIVPGFIDQHIHGANGKDVIDGKLSDLHEIATSLPSEGVTAFLATTTTQRVDVIEQTLASVSNYISKDYKEGSEIIGVHLEGPFISIEYCGAQLPNYILKPNVDTFKHFEKVSNNTIKLVTMAVEEDDNNELMKYLKSKNIVISIGHSSSNYKQVKNAIEHGATCITHTYNGMKKIHHREIGTVGSALLFDELYCELICDGIHVSKEAVKILHKNKPSDKIILITDALRTKNMPDGIYKELEQDIILKDNVASLIDGTLAGSVLKMNVAIKNMINFTGCDFITAIKYATENPAKNLGIYDKVGSIKENKDATFVIVDKDLNVYQTIRKGHVIYNK